MQEFETLNGQEYINLETFRKSGIGVKTPVWFVKEDNSLFVRTISNAGKVKRIRNNAMVNIAPCNADGSLLGEWLPAQAQVIKNDITAQRIDRLFDQKYGFRKKFFAFASSLFRRRYSFLELKVREEQ